MRWVYTLRSLLSEFLHALGVLFGMVPRVGRLPPYAYRAIHYAFIILLTLLLAWFSHRIIPPARVPVSNWFIQQYYLAIQFVLFYLFIRLLIAGVRLFLARDESEFEDIDRAWYAGLDAMAREGFDLQWLPVFLVNGLEPEQEQNFFSGVRMQWKVSGPTDDVRPSALSFYVCDEALFICLNNVGAMARQLQHTVMTVAAPAAAAAAEPTAQRTLRPGEVQAALQQTQRAEDLYAAAGKTLTPGAIAAAQTATMNYPGGGLGQTLLPGALGEHQAAAAPRPMVPQKLGKEDLALGRRRLKHLCRRLTAERGPYCPLNGLLQLIPLRWTESTAYEPLLAAAAQDVATLHRCTHMQFPVVCLHPGLEKLTGLAEFIERGMELDPRFRDSRAGSRYPAGLPVDEKSVRWVVERSLQWLRDWVYAEFAKNLASPQNRRLYQFLCALTQRRDRLCRELQFVFANPEAATVIRLSGCYFAATGNEISRQAFTHGVVQRVMDEQNDVAWTAEWRSRDRRHLVLAAFVSILVIAFLAADGWLAWQIWQQVSRATSQAL